MIPILTLRLSVGVFASMTLSKESKSSFSASPPLFVLLVVPLSFDLLPFPNTAVIRLNLLFLASARGVGEPGRWVEDSSVGGIADRRRRRGGQRQGRRQGRRR